ncbi:hypothetical protein [Roseicitreum antarcticum]|nr:hypothetical protein [Roseicitreum antarcticum]
MSLDLRHSPQIKALHGLRAVRPLANNMARIARGMRRYVLEADRPSWST